MDADVSMAWMQFRLTELTLAFSLLTRLPLPRLTLRQGVGVGAYVWAFPIAGFVVGHIAVIPLLLARAAGLSPSLAAIFALASGALATGALHEDGLADFWDGIGGGRTRERKLEIMRDSSIGSFGALALFLVLIARWAALAGMADAHQAAAALVMAHTVGRGLLAIVPEYWRPARRDGLAAGAGGSWLRSGAAILLTAALSLTIAEPAVVLVAMLAAAVAVVAIASLAGRHLGGYTGDVLGAAEQTAEALALIAVAALLGR